MKYLIAFLLGVFFSVNVWGEPAIGYDSLALQQRNFNEKEFIKFTPKNSATSNLDNTFSTDTAPLTYILSTHRPTFHRVHILNGSCVRGGNCGPYDVLYKLTVAQVEKRIRDRDKEIISYLKKRVAFYKGIQEKYPSTQILLSPILEHNLTKTAWRVLADTVKEVWPEAKLVNSPEGNGTAERYKGAYIERHGKRPEKDADIVSLDGSDGTDINIDAYIAYVKTLPRVFLNYLWTRSYNCRNLGKFEDPRVRKSCPISSTFELMGHLSDDRGKAPEVLRSACTFPQKGPNGSTVQVFKVRALKPPEIWKPLSEDSGNGDKRANLPVAIVYAGDAALSIIGANGKAVGRVGYYGAFNNGLFRYYSGYKGGSRWGGYGFERMLKSKTDSGYGWLKSSSQCIGPFVPGKRQGDFR